MTRPSSAPQRQPHSINDTFFQRLRTYFLCRVSKPWTKRPSPRVSVLPFGFVLKCGRQVFLSEAHNINFVAETTSIPVPRVVTAFTSKDNTYILLRRLKGVPLSTLFDTMTEEQKHNILLQLRGYVDELRALPPPQPFYVGGVNRNPLHDERINNGPLGPFSTVSEFHSALRHGFDTYCGHHEVDKLIELHNSREHSTVMSHGDLSFHNIVVQDNKITGIVDWETAGWYPEYWEYTNAFYSFFDCEHLRPRIDEFLHAYPEQREMERMRRRVFDMM